jgi:hypothetical protein
VVQLGKSYLLSLGRKEGKMTKTIGRTLSFFVIVALVLFNLSPAHTQDVGIWQGKWFQATFKLKGYCAEQSGMMSDSWTTTIYLKFETVNETFILMRRFIYVEEIGWGGQPIQVYYSYSPGKELDLLAWYLIQGDLYGGTGTEEMTFRIQGKKTKGILKSATVKSLGGAYDWYGIEEGPDESYCVGGITITGRLVSAGKVPQEIR